MPLNSNGTKHFKALLDHPNGARPLGSVGVLRDSRVSLVLRAIPLESARSHRTYPLGPSCFVRGFRSGHLGNAETPTAQTKGAQNNQVLGLAAILRLSRFGNPRGQLRRRRDSTQFPNFPSLGKATGGAGAHLAPPISQSATPPGPP